MKCFFCDQPPTHTCTLDGIAYCESHSSSCCKPTRTPPRLSPEVAEEVARIVDVTWAHLRKDRTPTRVERACLSLGVVYCVSFDAPGTVWIAPQKDTNDDLWLERAVEESGG